MLGADGETLITLKKASSEIRSGLLEWSLGEDHTIEESIEEIVCHAGPQHEFGVHTVAMTPDLDLALCGCDDDTVRLWKMSRAAWISRQYVSGLEAEGEEIFCLRGHDDVLNDVTITPDGHRGLSAYRDGTLCVWDLGAGACIGVLQAGSTRVNAIAISRDGELAVSGASDGSVTLWDISELGTKGRLDGEPRSRCFHVHAGSVSAIDLTADLRHGVSAALDGTIRVWDLKKGGQVTGMTVEAPILDLAVGSDGRTIIAGDETGHVHFIQFVDL